MLVLSDNGEGEDDIDDDFDLEDDQLELKR